MLRQRGIEPPKYHDVSSLFFYHKDKFLEFTEEEIKKLQKFQNF